MQQTGEGGPATGHHNIAFCFAGTADTADQRTETCGVHERDFGQVDQQLGFFGKIGERLTELADRVGVELASGTAQGVVIAILDVDLKHSFLLRCVAEHIGWITIIAVPHVLVATDADSLAEEIFSALAEPGTKVSRVRAGVDVRPAVVELEPDLVVLDLQIGNMGGVATSLDLRLEAEAGRVPDTQILMLLDRDADQWISRQAKADAELVKPVNSFTLRRAALDLIEA